MRKKLILIYFFFVVNIYSFQEKKISIPYPKNKDFFCNFGYIYIDSNEQGSGGGHTAILINNFVFHYQRIFNKFFILDKTPFSDFVFNYSRIQNRNINIICWQKDKIFLKNLHNELEYQHKKQEFYLYQYLYFKNLLENYQSGNYFIPTLTYFDFSKEELINLLNKLEIDKEKLINYYDGNIIYLILEIFYKNILSKNLKLNSDYFIEINDIPGFLKDDNFKKNIKDYLDLWDKEDEKLLNQKEPNKYLSLAYSLILKQTLIHIWKKEVILVPYLLVRLDNSSMYPLDIATKKISLTEKYFKKEFFLLIQIQKQLNFYVQELYTLIQNKEPLYRIQFYLNKITYLSNQLILLQNKKIFDLQTKIMNLPDLTFSNPDINKIIHKKIKNIPELQQEIQKHIYSIVIKNSEIFDYHLIFDNCVTRLIELIYKNIQDPDFKKIFHKIYDKNHKLLFTLKGNFIPWISYDTLKKELKANQIPYTEYQFLSFRNEYLKNQKQNIKKLKEISTITSPIYEYNSMDSFFVFFTEDHIYLRPVFGSINFLTSIAKIGIDIVLLPYAFYKENITIQKEFRGLFFSFTEILFVSIRKGTFLSEKHTDESLKLFLSLPELQKNKNISLPY